MPEADRWAELISDGILYHQESLMDKRGLLTVGGLLVAVLLICVISVGGPSEFIRYSTESSDSSGDKTDLATMNQSASSSGTPAVPLQPQGPSPEIKEYVRQIVDATALFQEAMKQNEEGSHQLGQDPYLIKDKTWQMQMIVSLGGLKAYAQKINEIVNVPSEMSNLHNDMTEMARLADRFATIYAQAIDDVDAEAMRKARTYKEQMNAVAARATPKIEALLTKHGH